MKPSLRPRSGAPSKVRSSPTSRNTQRHAAPDLLEIVAQRQRWILILFSLCIFALVSRAVYLQVMHREFLQAQANARLLRDVDLPAHRGMLLDRNAQPLAVSVPVDSVWINPQLLIKSPTQWADLMALLGQTPADLKALMKPRMQREFIYLKRHIAPSLSAQISALDIPGVYLQKEYRRYYPAAHVTAHLLGFTNIDDAGQEGVELALNARLQGHSGKRRVIQDRKGHTIALVEQFKTARPGEDITLSLDRRLASIAHQALAHTVKDFHAKAAAAVILDARSGEILSLNSIPSYNPNDRSDRNSTHYRNRVVTDVFEPGSTLKPFTIAAALESGQYTASSLINTGRGHLKIGGFSIDDAAAYGRISIGKVLKKSSNVGAAKIALSLTPEHFWNTLYYAGFGRVPDSGLPGEVSGHLPYYTDWGRTRRASMGFGYGLSVSLLQLAHAYTAIANHGLLPALSLYPLDKIDTANSVKVMQAQHADAILNMLDTVVGKGGTGRQAAVAGFRVAGKTGTARKFIQGRYTEDRHLSLFVGIAPVSDPRLVVAVMVDEPQGKQYYGGQVAAPVFSEIMRKALRVLNVMPDAL